MSDSDFRETLYTIDQDGNRQWVYSTEARGRFARARTVVASVLMAIYLCMPWLKINGRQAVLLDIANRKFVFFGQEFWATDTIFLMLLLGALGFTLFFFTALLGRVWCGWACPETVFLEFLFRPLERLIEGNATRRRRLDEADWTFEKIIRKGTKYVVFAALAWLIASTALAYFFGSERMLAMMSNRPTANLGPFLTTLCLMVALLFQFGWFREQFCTVLCPYGRFQSVMLDANSLVIGYDLTRGEPRGKLRKGDDLKSRGHCVDCGACVRVCPTGIDIRNGLQLECINCAACIDACASIMDQVGYPRGLIRYDTENRLSGKPSRILRPRLFLYVLVLVFYLSAFTYLLSNRKLFDADLIRTTGSAMYQVLPDGRLSNQLHLMISNKGNSLRRFIVVCAERDVELVLPGSPFPVAPGKLERAPLFINFPKQLLVRGKKLIELTIITEGEEERREVTLIGPDN